MADTEDEKSGTDISERIITSSAEPSSQILSTVNNSEEVVEESQTASESAQPVESGVGLASKTETSLDESSSKAAAESSGKVEPESSGRATSANVAAESNNVPPVESAGTASNMEPPQIEEETEEEIAKAKEEQRMRELWDSMRLKKPKLQSYENPLVFSDISMASWDEDFKPFVRYGKISAKNVHCHLERFLRNDIFVVIYKKGVKRHREFACLLNELSEPFVMIGSDLVSQNHDCTMMLDVSNIDLSSAPFVLFRDAVYRSMEELEELLFNRLVPKPLGKHRDDYDFDLIILGNTMAGLYAAGEAAKYSDRVMLVHCFDTFNDTTRNLKRRMIRDALRMFERVRLGYKCGFEFTWDTSLNWQALSRHVNDHANKCAFKMRLLMNTSKLLESKAKFNPDGSLQVKDGNVTSECYIIATGSTPNFPSDIIGLRAHSIPPEMLYYLKDVPTDTLIIGDFSEGLECAEILNACEKNVTVIVQEGTYDKYIYEKTYIQEIQDFLDARGVTFVKNCRILRVSSDGDKKFVEGIYDNEEEFTGTFEAVIVALGRKPRTEHLGLENTGVTLTKSRHVKVDKLDKTDDQLTDIYAIGPVAGREESDSASEKAAVNLVNRLFDYGTDKTCYEHVTRMLFTLVEYGCVGITEEKAEALVKQGDYPAIHVYEKKIQWPGSVFPKPQLAAKILCTEDEDGFKQILGIHILGHEVSDIITGFTVLMGEKRKIKRFDKILSCQLMKNLWNEITLKRVITVETLMKYTLDTEKIERSIRYIEMKEREIEKRKAQEEEQAKRSQIMHERAKEKESETDVKIEKDIKKPILGDENDKKKPKEKENFKSKEKSRKKEEKEKPKKDEAKETEVPKEPVEEKQPEAPKSQEDVQEKIEEGQIREEKGEKEKERKRSDLKKKLAAEALKARRAESLVVEEESRSGTSVCLDSQQQACVQRVFEVFARIRDREVAGAGDDGDTTAEGSTEGSVTEAGSGDSKTSQGDIKVTEEPKSGEAGEKEPAEPMSGEKAETKEIEKAEEGGKTDPPEDESAQKKEELLEHEVTAQ